MAEILSPASPLPFRVSTANSTPRLLLVDIRDAQDGPVCEFTGDDASDLSNARYLVHAANLYPELIAALRFAERFCPCGARPESPQSHPHVVSCPISAALRKAEREA